MIARLCGIATLLLFLAVPAHGADLGSLTDKIQKQYQSLTSFTADFNQVLKNASSKQEENRTGRLSFAQPALIRWETEKPEKEILVVGKDAVWNAFEDEKTAYRYSVEDVLGSKTMLRFLSGQGNLKEDFHISEEQGAPKGQVKLKMVPKEAEPSLVLAFAWVDTATFMLARIAIEDFYGNVNDVTLSNVKMNPSLSKNMFQYSPPKDFEILDNTAPAGPAGMGAPKGKKQ